MQLNNKISTAFSFAILVLIDMSCSSGNDPQPVDCSALKVEAPAATLISPTGCATTDGSITLVASGGKEPYQYAIDGGTVFQAASLFTGLSSGVYTVVVKDANECINKLEGVALTNTASDLQVSGTSVSNSSCKTSTGSITITASGGQTPYQYSVNGGAFGSSATIDALTAGNYLVTVKDALGCSVTKGSVKVETGVSYISQIKEILRRHRQIGRLIADSSDGGDSISSRKASFF